MIQPLPGSALVLFLMLFSNVSSAHTSFAHNYFVSYSHENAWYLSGAALVLGLALVSCMFLIRVSVLKNKR